MLFKVPFWLLFETIESVRRYWLLQLAGFGLEWGGRSSAARLQVSGTRWWALSDPLILSNSCRRWETRCIPTPTVASATQPVVSRCSNLTLSPGTHMADPSAIPQRPFFLAPPALSQPPSLCHCRSQPVAQSRRAEVVESSAMMPKGHRKGGLCYHVRNVLIVSTSTTAHKCGVGAGCRSSEKSPQIMDDKSARTHLSDHMMMLRGDPWKLFPTGWRDELWGTLPPWAQQVPMAMSLQHTLLCGCLRCGTGLFFGFTTMPWQEDVNHGFLKPANPSQPNTIRSGILLACRIDSISSQTTGIRFHDHINHPRFAGLIE